MTTADNIEERAKQRYHQTIALLPGPLAARFGKWEDEPYTIHDYFKDQVQQSDAAINRMIDTSVGRLKSIARQYRPTHQGGGGGQISGQGGVTSKMQSEPDWIEVPADVYDYLKDAGILDDASKN